MGKRFVALLFLAAAVVAPCAALAGPATFHVSTTGNDGGTGSLGDPWATITHALTQVADGDLVLVGAGTYAGRVTLSGRFASGVTVRAEPLYGARLQSTTQQAMICFACEGITLEGFEITHSGPGASALVVQVQDTDPFDGLSVGRLVLRNNIFHDSYNNDLVKVNNAATDVLITGNMFYNQAGSDEHLDINSVDDVIIQDNVFFNDFSGSGRSDTDTSSYIVIKDSNGNSDGVVGSSNIVVRRNVFLHWEGSSGQGFVRVGEDGTSTFEADGVLIENNLMLGDNTAQIRSPFQVQGSRNVTIQANTVSGNLPAKEFGFRIVTGGSNPDSENIHLHNNVWSDPQGSMGDTFNRGSTTVNLTFDNNAFWNDGNAFPTSGESIVEVADDASAVFGDPVLVNPSGVTLPRFVPLAGNFADGSATIREVFESLVAQYGVPGVGSTLVDAADPAWVPTDDILGANRSLGGLPDIGAVEIASCSTAVDGTSCDDGNVCTTADECSGGVCGGIDDDGAPCDDGNECTAPDICSAGTCVGSDDNGAVCDDGDPCSGPDLCALGVCTSSIAPRVDCAAGDKGDLRIRASSKPGKDLLQWSWSGPGVLLGDFGDPVSGGTDYALCIYDEVAATPAVVFSSFLSAGAACDGKACWKAQGSKGFRYKSSSGGPDGVRQLKLKASGKGSIKLKAGRAALNIPALPLSQDPRVTVQLSAGQAACWETDLVAPASRNDAENFRDQP